MMNNIFNFLLENYRLIVDGIAIIVAFVFFLIRKKPVKIVDSAIDWLMKMIPAVVIGAEATALKGTAKMEYVLQTLKDVAIKSGVIQEDSFDFYVSFIKEYVEIILSTPQKKGVTQ